ncbi:SGNH/GDSL hydrolase family protein [Deinococcus sonorensis]|uniref:GDSL-type esterase/lipase family protein n=2 Tax=Deinococcus sonorensis TaxID=309891 RepID=A0AAU7UE09_9DEIO
MGQRLKQMLLGALGLLTLGCAPRQQAGPQLSGYVAMGDSLTAGMQSGGLVARDQQQAYPVLLGQRAGLDVQMPLFQAPGCPPPMQVGDRDRRLAQSCVRVDPAQPTQVVAVPGARVLDVLETTDRFVRVPDPLLYDQRQYRLILGAGTTQLQAALSRHPHFITLWIGSNDVLMPTLRGHPEQATPPAEFRAEYAQLLTQLTRSGAEVVVLTVPDVTRVPGLMPVTLLRAGGLVDQSCEGRGTYLSSVALAGVSRERPLHCPAEAELSAEKYRQAQQTVQAYNAAIRELAAQAGASVFDVNPLLDQLPGRPLIPTAQSPFGVSFSLDGIHPSVLTHRRLAAELARFLNRTYGFGLDSW